MIITASTTTASEAAIIDSLMGHDMAMPADYLLPFAPGNIARMERAGKSVNLMTGQVEASPQDDWLDFTTRWVEEARRRSVRVHYSLLAMAMSRADAQRQPWEHYTGLACVNLQIAVALFNGTLEARRRKLERLGNWQLSHDGQRWHLEAASDIVSARELGDLMDLAEHVQGHR